MGKHRWPTAGDAELQGPPSVVHQYRDGNGSEEPTVVDRWLEEEAPGSVRLPVRWRVARSAALVFLGVALAIGGALFLIRSSEPSAAALSVQLEPPQVASEQPDAAQLDPESNTPGQPNGPPGSTVTEAGQEAPGPATGESVGPPDQDSGGVELVVYLTGAVASPGVVTAPPGTRLFVFIEKAGGPTPEADLEGINLASIPTDGMHIHLLAMGEEPRAGSDAAPAEVPSGSTGGPAAGQAAEDGGSPGPVAEGVPGLIDLNSATLAELESLPRIGPVLAQRILDWREQNGPFTQPADLDAVPGIGPAMLEGILPLVAVR